MEVENRKEKQWVLLVEKEYTDVYVSSQNKYQIVNSVVQLSHFDEFKEWTPRLNILFLHYLNTFFEY